MRHVLWHNTRRNRRRILGVYYLILGVFILGFFVTFPGAISELLRDFPLLPLGKALPVLVPMLVPILYLSLRELVVSLFARRHGSPPGSAA